MTTQEWKDLPDLQLVATAQAEGWEIMKRLSDECVWVPWYGEVWSKASQYRGRPKQPKTRTVTSECWRHTQHGGLSWGKGISEMWQRFPAGDITGEVEE